MIEDNNERVDRNKDYINVKIFVQNLYKVNIKILVYWHLMLTLCLVFDFNLFSMHAAN